MTPPNSNSTTERTRVKEKTETDEDNKTVEDENNRHECPECEEGRVIKNEAKGEMVCENCSLVVEDGQIDAGPEWRAFNSSERDEKSRVGAPTTKSMHDKGLTTNIDWKNRDASGRMISPDKRSQMARLRKWQERIRTKDAGERNLQFALSEIDRMASAIGLPQAVRETASVVYRRALKDDLIRGRSIEGVATASLYAACRQESVPRSLEEIAKFSRVERKEIGRTYRYMSQELGLELKPVDPQQYVPRFCSKLEVSERVQQKANEIIEETAKKGLLSGKSPTGYAAAAIYAAALLCNEKRTQKEVAEVAQVTEVTIRNRYQEQIEALDIQ